MQIKSIRRFLFSTTNKKNSIQITLKECILQLDNKETGTLFNSVVHKGLVTQLLVISLSVKLKTEIYLSVKEILIN